MKRRCVSVTDCAFNSYGGRGISFDKKWLTFDGFIDDMGFPNVENPTIDRIDPNGDYTKNNCRWISRKYQAYNRIGKRNKNLPKGVVKVRDVYRSRIRFEKKLIHLGYFKTQEDAAKAYNKQAKELFGEYALLNQTGQVKGATK